MNLWCVSVSNSSLRVEVQLFDNEEVITLFSGSCYDYLRWLSLFSKNDEFNYICVCGVSLGQYFLSIQVRHI